MCRLFGLHAGAEDVDAEFWLLDAPDSLDRQSRRNADGFGIGIFTAAGAPLIDKAPRPAWQDTDFATAAHRLRGRTFLGHVRHASTGGLTMANTHPFLQDGRLFAHNGAIQGLPVLDQRLRQLGVISLLHGETDSERIFALITAEIRARDGDVNAAITAAVEWLRSHVPITSLNFVLTAPANLWAFRYPETDELLILERLLGGSRRGDALSTRGSSLAAHADELDHRPSVVIASEQIDDDPRWRPLASGELVHIGPDLTVSSVTLPA